MLQELECPEEKEIELLVEGLIDEKFTEAYSRIDCEENKEQAMRIQKKVLQIT